MDLLRIVCAVFIPPLVVALQVAIRPSCHIVNFKQLSFILKPLDQSPALRISIEIKVMVKCIYSVIRIR